MNRRGILASCAANCSGLLNGCQSRRSSQGFLDTCLRRPPGWPFLEALAITAAALLVLTLAVELGAALAASGTAAVFDGSKVTLTSDANGLAAGPIPRSASLLFTARRGARGKRVRFTGADADSLALPALVGAP
jgi:hypothetical protein